MSEQQVQQDPKKLIDDLKNAAMFAQKLSDIQIENLKMYAFAPFEEKALNGVVMSWDVNFEGKDRGALIKYDFQVEDPERFMATPKLKKRLAFIQGCVRTLLWSDTVVEFTVNGEKIKENID